MKNRRTLKMILALGGMVTSLAFASKGGSVSSGGEHITYERNPWFIGSEPVHYCIEIAEENFSLSLGEANLAIQSAIADWTKTLRTLKPRPTGTNYVHNEPKNLTLQFEYDSVCNSKSELRFLFGVMNASIQSDLKGHAAHTIAYSKMSSIPSC